MSILKAQIIINQIRVYSYKETLMILFPVAHRAGNRARRPRELPCVSAGVLA
ncbi:hypothetical protein AXF42_Ash017326 [Apostasia shenzhenica]|uniref:Uncharacterized protein n=1 Tax=Apostasia shenzhenica TaxID=1088818 RepID=A0A2I0BDD1_9ASPA|nr:hypothetical protein AXF42_Ash017326 [Apostasia shenzhenica]